VARAIAGALNARGHSDKQPERNLQRIRTNNTYLVTVS
jgi:hypothetical protein